MNKAYLGLLLGGVVAAAVATGVALSLLVGGGEETTPSAKAPDFTLPATDGRTVSLAQFQAKKHVLLFFSMGNG